MYCVISDPPSDAGAVNGTDAVVPSIITVPTVGDCGIPAKVTLFDVADGAEVPN